MELFQVPKAARTRWATWENPDGRQGGADIGYGRKNSPAITNMRAGACYTLAHAEEGGTVRRIWITIPDRDADMLENVRLRMYWDGCAEPAVDVPLGIFFGHALGRMVTFQSALFSSPEGRSFTCVVPMPFRTGMRIEALNGTERNIPMFFYEVDYTLGDEHGEDVMYFHALYRRENPTEPLRDFEVLPRVRGRGRYLGATFGVRADTARYFKTWWGEGEVKVYLDGDREHPTLCGTGTEDYIGTGWGQGQYAHLYQGCPLADHEQYEYGFYRLHVPDPVYFQQECRVTIQQIGCFGDEHIPQLYYSGIRLRNNMGDVIDFNPEHTTGIATFERQDDWSSCCYYYLDRP